MFVFDEDNQRRAGWGAGGDHIRQQARERRQHDRYDQGRDGPFDRDSVLLSPRQGRVCVHALPHLRL